MTAASPMSWRPDAVQHEIKDLPDDVLVFLLGSRYCDTDRLSDFAWSQFAQYAAGLGPRPGDLRFRAQPYRLQLPERRLAAHRPWRLHRPDRCLPRLRASGDHALPLHEHPGPLLHGLSRRHRRPARARPDGLQRLVRGLSERTLVHVRRPPQSATDRPDPDGRRPRRHRRRPVDQLRPIAGSRASRWSPTRCRSPS